MTTHKKWHVIFEKKAEKDFLKFDRQVQEAIYQFFQKKIMSQNDPRILGKSLSGNLRKFWAYRIGDYRVIAKIEDNQLVILVVAVGHRREIYDA